MYVQFQSRHLIVRIIWASEIRYVCNQIAEAPRDLRGLRVPYLRHWLSVKNENYTKKNILIAIVHAY